METDLLTFDELGLAIRKSWDRYTSAYLTEWKSSIPAYGQCVPTSLIVQDYFGGDLIESLILTPAHRGGKTSNHYNNLIGGEAYDLTWSQFTDWSQFSEHGFEISEIRRTPEIREELLENELVAARYNLLKNRVIYQLIFNNAEEVREIVAKQ